MSEKSLQRDARRAFKAANRRGTFDRFLLGLVVLLTLARASEALAGDQAPAAGGARFSPTFWMRCLIERALARILRSFSAISGSWPM